jgi:sRNA-binding carbon storage regulator CsrA
LNLKAGERVLIGATSAVELYEADGDRVGLLVTDCGRPLVRTLLQPGERVIVGELTAVMLYKRHGEYNRMTFEAPASVTILRTEALGRREAARGDDAA